MCCLQGHIALRPCWFCANVVFRMHFTRNMSPVFVDHTCIGSKGDPSCSTPRNPSGGPCCAWRPSACMQVPARCTSRRSPTGCDGCPTGSSTNPRSTSRRRTKMLDWCHVYLCGGLADVELGHGSASEVARAYILRRAGPARCTLEVAKAVRPPWHQFRRTVRQE